MLKKLLALFAVSLLVSACNSLGPSASQSIVLPNGKQGYSIDCTYYSGWPACFEVAGTLCKAGYRIHERSMDEHTRSELPVEPLEKDANTGSIISGHPHADVRNQKAKYMIVSCK